jgi:hypothetical protein
MPRMTASSVSPPFPPSKNPPAYQQITHHPRKGALVREF